MKRKEFRFYFDYLGDDQTIKSLSMEELGELSRAIFDYGFTNKEPDFSDNKKLNELWIKAKEKIDKREKFN